MSSTAIITCHFNWCDYQRPRANLRRFQRQMVRTGVPLYGVEAYLKHQEPVTKGWPGWRQIQVTRRHVMFLKENLLNLAENLVPTHFDKIAWIDADVDFENPDWLEETNKKLDEFPVVQPFSRALWMNLDGSPCRDLVSCAALAQSDDHLVGHPGFAWAARRELWTDHGGLYPFAICGHGDIVNATGYYGGNLRDIQRGFGSVPDALWHWEAWRDQIINWTRRKVGSVTGNIWHEWHGDIQNRRYAERTNYLDGFNPHEHLEEDENGLLRWHDDAPPEMMGAVAKYFSDRQEDG